MKTTISRMIENNYAEDLHLATDVSATGDMSRFEELYRKYFKKVYSICLKMTSNAEDAEDLAHEVFINIQRTLKSYRGESSLSSWLRSVTINHVLMRFRKKSVRSEMTTIDGLLPEIGNTYNSSASLIIDHIALADAVQHLAKGYRQIFLLHDLLGYDHEEIANKLRIHIGTSKSQLHKARLKLREHLHERSLLSTQYVIP